MHAALGYAWIQKGRTDKAVDCFRKARDRQPDWQPYLTNNRLVPYEIREQALDDLNRFTRRDLLKFLEPRPGLEDLPLISPGRAGWWLGNTGMILLIYELSLAGQTALAALWVLQVLMAWALNTERRLRVPEDRRGEIGQPYLALHAAVRDIARALHLAVATPLRAARRLLRRKT